ncbi:MAG: response regulator [Bacteroidales bacterium]
MEETLRVLILEDNPADAELANEELKETLNKYTVKVVDTKNDFILAMDNYKPDLIISDYQLPGFNALSALKIAREKSPFIPFIIYTGAIKEEAAVECMKSGADDYVMKENMIRLRTATLHALENKKSEKEKYQSLQSLKKSEEKYRLLIDSSIDAIYLLYNRKFEFINKAFEKLFGYTYEEVNQPGFDFTELVAPKSRPVIEERAKKIARGEKPGSKYEFTAVSKTGREIEVEVNESYIEYNQGIATQGIVRNITERKQYEEELIKAKEKAEESDKLKTAFLQNMSHEIRTPMNGILGFTSLLLEPDLTSEKRFNFIEIIQKCGERMLNTINDIIEVSKIEAGLVSMNLAPVNVNARLYEIKDFFTPEAEQKGLQLTLENILPNDHPDIRTDKNKLDSILANLVKNAIKFTDSGTVKLGCNFQEPLLEFYVKDTGIGIPAHRREAVFNRFEQADIADTRAFQGSGLGLAIAKSYIEKLGGKIWLESEEGKGSTFYFSLPAKSDMEEKLISDKKISVHNENEKSKVKGLKILIAEDDETSRKYLSLLVNDFGTEILEAETGNRTIELCRQNKDIDLILMDIRMPGLDGYEATRRIREFNKEIVIIAQTAIALSGAREKAIEAGCNDHISKPINKNELLTIIEQYV